MKEKKTINIEIWTPYLTENVAEKYGAEFEEEQMRLFGYDPKGIIGKSKIITPRNIVLIEKEEGLVERPDFIIAGCTLSREETVESLKGSGLLIARYSIFYGGASDYSSNYPNESGYAFDIPKKPDVVKSLLKHDDFLEAIVAREESKIRSAVDKFNETIERPVLITDYLAEALGYR